MADHFVNSSATTGANDGTSKTDAWLALASSLSVAAGDTVFCSHTHSETLTLSQVYNYTNSTAASPVKIISINFTGDAFTQGAKISQDDAANDDITFSGVALYYGIDLDIANDLHFGVLAADYIRFEDFVFNYISTFRTPELSFGIDQASTTDFVRGSIDYGTNSAAMANGGILLSGGPRVKWIDVTYDKGSTTTTTLIGASGSVSSEGAIFEMVGCEIIGFTSVFLSTAAVSSIFIDKTKLPATFTEGTVAVGAKLLITNSTDGTLTVPPLPLFLSATNIGTTSATLARFRTGGADDGEQANAYSIEMIAGANAVENFNPLELLLPLAIWVDGGSSITFTIFVASGVTLQDDEFWAELVGPDDAVSATARGHYITSRPDPNATPANLTTDSVSTWSGTGVGTKQQIDITYTPDIAGLVEITPFLAKASTTVYVDYKIGLS